MPEPSETNQPGGIGAVAYTIPDSVAVHVLEELTGEQSIADCSMYGTVTSAVVCSRNQENLRSALLDKSTSFSEECGSHKSVVESWHLPFLDHLIHSHSVYIHYRVLQMLYQISWIDLLCRV